MSCLMVNDIDAGIGRFGELLFNRTRKSELNQIEEKEKQMIIAVVFNRASFHDFLSSISSS